jgi:hypothetical protein
MVHAWYNLDMRITTQRRVGGLVLLWLCAAGAFAGVLASPHDAVWSPDMDTIGKARSEASLSGDAPAALQRTMRAAGARPQALAFSEQLGKAAGFLLKLSPRGSVFLGTVFYPFRSEDTLEPVILTPAGGILWPARPDTASLARDPRVADLNRRRPELTIGPCGESASEVRTAADGAVEVRFEYGLRAPGDSADSGTATLSYHFTRDGTFSKIELSYLRIDQ